ncbi:hypothetical protein FQN51_002679 [Onygenales sp. PD_10]|nr:hypothetical protein FQN51_002679 [Onygenales sp. PD_10]
MPSQFLLTTTLLTLSLPSLVHSAFTPCPILGPSFPYPKISTGDKLLKSALGDLTGQFNELVETGNSSHGTVTPDTTSFSIALFTSDNNEEDKNNAPFFYEYHYTAPALEKSHTGVQAVDSDSVYRIGGLTQLFTVLTTLVEAGDSLWNEPVTKLVPELAEAAGRLDAKRDPVKYVDWEEVTVGHLSSHMAGIARDYCIDDLIEELDTPTEYGLPSVEKHSCSSKCGRSEFFDGFTNQPPVYLPDTTPIFSNAAFRILSYILEDKTGKSFEAVLNSKIFAPLEMSHSSLFKPSDASHGVIPGDEKDSGWATSFGEGAAAQSMFSSVRDLSKAGKAILSSTLISPAQTRRWFKPVSHTSNPANSIGRPWVIYSGGDYPQTAMIDVYTVLGDLGSYSSYIGIVPDYDVGFTILAADGTGAPDLNAHADIIADVLLPALIQMATLEAAAAYGGEYASSHNSSLTISADELPGLFVEEWVSNGVDYKAELGDINGIDDPSAVSIRLYPTDRITKTESGSRRAFRAVIQDMNEEADNGTPTCVSWMEVDALKYAGSALDEIVFEIGEDGRAVAVEVPALRTVLERSG